MSRRTIYPTTDNDRPWHPDEPKNRQAVGIIVRRGTEDFLLLRRSKHEDTKVGLWELPGGKVDPGQDEMEAALTELREETGLIATEDDLTLIATHSAKGKDYHIYSLRLTPEMAMPVSGWQPTLSIEHDRHMWVRFTGGWPTKVSHHLKAWRSIAIYD